MSFVSTKNPSVEQNETHRAVHSQPRRRVVTRPEAARQNGALSHGPKSDAGKTISSRNAIKHGLTSAEIVIPGEDPRAFEALLENINVDHGPVTVREHDLAFEMAAARWRLRRLMIMEKAIIDRELRRMTDAGAEPSESLRRLTPEQARAEAWAAVAESQGMKQIHRHETRLHREYNAAFAALENLTDERCRVEMRTNGIHPCTKELLDAGPEQRHATAMAIIGSRPGAQTERREPQPQDVAAQEPEAAEPPSNTSRRLKNSEAQRTETATTTPATAPKSQNIHTSDESDSLGRGQTHPACAA